MAALNSKNPTLLDVVNMPENGEMKEIVDLLAQFNPMVQDAPAFACNKGSYHQTTVRTGLPTPTWGSLYAGIPQSKGSRQMIKDTPGFLEASSGVDTRLVDVFESAEEKASIRMEEAEGHLEAMAQEAATALVYHDLATDPEKMMGFFPRFNLLSAENGGQIIDAAGTGSDNASILMTTWDKKGCHLIYPKNHIAGIQRKDRGEQRVLDASGNPYFEYQEDFTWHLGLTVRDWRYVARVANIDVSDLTTNAATGANLFDKLTEAYYTHYGRKVGLGKTMIYCNTDIVKYLDYQARKATNTNLFLTYGEAGPDAKEVLHFRGVAIRESDAMLSTEARVV